MKGIVGSKFLKSGYLKILKGEKLILNLLYSWEQIPKRKKKSGFDFLFSQEMLSLRSRIRALPLKICVCVCVHVHALISGVYAFLLKKVKFLNSLVSVVF